MRCQHGISDGVAVSSVLNIHRSTDWLTRAVIFTNYPVVRNCHVIYTLMSFTARIEPALDHLDAIQVGAIRVTHRLHQERRWREERGPGAENRPPPPGVCVNLSARQLSEGNFVAEVRELLARTGTAPHAFGIEVTESMLAEDERVSDALADLRKMGVTVVIDDFGVGYSPLSYLNKSPANLLNIDCSFVQELGDNPERAAMVSGIVTLAHAAGKEAIAKCVENPRQLALLEEIGCEMGHGNYFSEPLPARAATQLVQSYTPEKILPGRPGGSNITS